MSDAKLRATGLDSWWLPWALGLGVLWASGGGCGSEPSKSANPAVQQASAVAPTAPTAPPRPAAPAPLPTPGVVPSAAAPQVSELAMVLGSAVNVRPGAGTSFPPRGRIHCGDLVAIRGREGDWLQIQLGELTGYSHSAYLVEVKAGQGSRPTCEFAHRGITAPRRKQPEKLPTTPSASPQVALSKIVAGNAVPEQVAVAAATLPSASRPAGSPAAAPTPPPTPAVKPAAAAGADAQPQLVWLSTHGLKPKVMFPHPHHAQMFACAKCHHPLGSPGPNKDKDCSTCHIAGGKGQSPVSNKDAFHQTCRACHEATGRGPTACQECHSGGK